MDDLAATFTDAGMHQVTTFLASGNVIFQTNDCSEAELITRLEAAFHKRFEFSTNVLVRTLPDLETISAWMPITVEERAGAQTDSIGFAGSRMPPDVLRILVQLGDESDRFAATETEIHWLSLNRQSEASFTVKQLERALGLPISFRNRTTVQRITAKCKQDS